MSDVTSLLDKILGAKTQSPQPEALSAKCENITDTRPWTDDQVLRLFELAKNWTKFDRLFNFGDTSEYDNDDSRADEGLCSMLAFYTRDPVQMDRLFQRSALYREEKWGARADYREGTISYALTHAREWYTGLSPEELTAPVPIIGSREKKIEEQIPPEESEPKEQKPERKIRWTVKELMTMDFPDPNWAVDGIVPEGLTILAGRPKRGKSFLALQIACAIGTGSLVLNVQTKQGKVLVLALEDYGKRIQMRIRKQGWDWSRIEGDIFTQWPIGPKGLASFEALVKEEEYNFIVIDTLSRFLGSVDQNDVGKMTSYMDYIQNISFEYSVPMLVVDHHKKITPFAEFDQIEDVLGSTAKSAVADGVMGLYKTPEGETLLKVVSRDAEAASYSLDFDTETCLWTMLGDAEEVQKTQGRKDILEAIKSLIGLDILPTTTNIAKHLEKDTGNIGRDLNGLLFDGQVIKGQKIGKEQPYEIVVLPNFFKEDF